MQEYPKPQPGGWRIFVWFAVFFFLFDVVLFRFFFWSLPDESAWAELPFYNFEYRARASAKAPPQPETPRIVFAGSSLALYSVLPDELESELTRRLNKRAVDVRILSHQGMSTMHLAAYADRILAAKPDVVVVPVGTVDFRLERPIMQGIERLDSSEDGVRAAALAESRRYTVSKPEFRMLAPGGWFREYHADLDLNQKASALLAATIATYRYRLLAWGPVTTLINNRFARGRSYHEYAGVPIYGGGISHRGWTGREFEIPVTPALIRTGFLFQAPSELFAAAAPETPSITVTRIIRDDEGETGKLDSRRQWTRTLKPGWQLLPLRSPGTADPEDFGAPGDDPIVTARDRLKIHLSHVSYSEANADERGIRLTRNAGREVRALQSLPREVRREDNLYRDYDDQQYRESFARRVLQFDRAGSEYLEALKLARHVWSARAFDSQLPGFVALDRFRKRLAEAGVPLLIVNNPENPISLAWYGDSVWYADYLRFLAAAPDTDPDQYFFYDASRSLEMQMFYDYHHLSYHGAIRYSRAVAPKLEEILTTGVSRNR